MMTHVCGRWRPTGRAAALTALLCLPMVSSSPALSGDWPQWGGRPVRNMVSDEKGLPGSFDPPEKKADGQAPDMAQAANLIRALRLGSQTYGSPVIAGGRVFVGTNNGAPRNPRNDGDWGALYCFEEGTGKFLWQLMVSKLRDEGTFNGDFSGLGICSSPTVEGDRLYVVTSRCEVLCLDVQGLSNGNDGAFLDEGEYVAVRVRRKPGKHPGVKPEESAEGPKPPIPDPTDADIIWRYDLIAELDVWPQDATDCSVLVIGDLVYVDTSNGVDRSHKNIPSPDAPSLIALDKRTGRLVAADGERIGPRIHHGQWSSPSLADIPGRPLVLFGAGDGFLYAFDPVPVDPPAGGVGPMLLHAAWKCDANPPEYRARDGKVLPYNQNGEGPSEIIGTPVFHEGRVYVTVGQDTRHGPGRGALTCIDASAGGEGDRSSTGKVWTYTGIDRSMATPSVVGGLVFATDYRGVIHCVDARTGERLWIYETKAMMMGSTLVADGKVYAGTEAGKLVVLAAAREKRLLGEARLGSPMHCTPVAANGLLYIAAHKNLFVLGIP